MLSLTLKNLPMKKLGWVHVLWGLIAIKLFVHFYLNGQWSFHRDELLYLALGQHLDWGYLSVPAGIGFWAWFGNTVLGGSVWAIRLISTLFGTLTILLTGLIAKEMLQPEEGRPSGRFAMLMVGLAGLVSGAFLRPSMLFMPVVFDTFYWTLLCWLFIKYINTEKNSWLLWMGLATGLGLLNKYTVAMFLFAMFVGLILTRRFSIFKEKKLYLAIGLALLIVSPNLVWQARHDFPLVRHISDLSKTQFVHVSPGSFFGDQILFFLPALFVWICGLYFLLFNKNGRQWRVFGFMYLAVLTVLLAFNAKSYYSLGAYPVLIAAGAVFLEQQTANKFNWLRYFFPVLMAVIGLVTVPAALPILPPEQEAHFVKKLTKIPGLEGILRWEDGNYYALPQDFADMIGWEELGRKTGEVWQHIPDKSTAAVYAENYGQAGAIEQFGKVHKVWSFSDNYRYWLPDSLPSNFQTLVYINDELGDDMHGFFKEIEKVWELDMPLSRQHGDQIYLCKYPTAAFFQRMNTAIQQAKKDEEIDD